jgi:hypothetical protein
LYPNATHNGSRFRIADRDLDGNTFVEELDVTRIKRHKWRTHAYQLWGERFGAVIWCKNEEEDLGEMGEEVPHWLDELLDEINGVNVKDVEDGAGPTECFSTNSHIDKSHTSHAEPVPRRLNSPFYKKLLRIASQLPAKVLRLMNSPFYQKLRNSEY